MTSRCLFLFIDALSARYLDDPSLMPKTHDFMNSFHSSEFIPVLGYSQAIKSSIFTGKPPSITDVYGKYRFNFVDSPMKWLSRFPFKNSLDEYPFIRYPINMILSFVFGLPRNNIPLSAHHFLKFHELEDPFNYTTIGGAQTVFSKINSSGGKFHFYGYPVNTGDQDAISSARKTISNDDLTVVYLGELDHAGHHLSFENPNFRLKLKEYDKIISDFIDVAQRNSMSLLLFSDHGMSKVNSSFNIISSLRRNDILMGRDIAAIIDSTLFRAISLRNNFKLKEILSNLKNCHLLTESEKKEFGLDFPNRDHGELFLLLDEGFVFLPGFYDVTGRLPEGMHGYSPLLNSQHGILISTREADHLPNLVTYADVFAELCSSLNL